MSQQPFQFQVPVVKNTSNKDVPPINITLNQEQVLFVLGANGTGKSALMYWFNKQQLGAVRILSQRQGAFPDRIFDTTMAQKKHSSVLLKWEREDPKSRVSDNHGEERIQISINSLISGENILNRDIAQMARKKMDSQKLSEFLSKNPGKISFLNNLLKIANLSIEILVKGDILVAKNSKVGGSDYIITDLSDGERNVLWIACEVITAPENSLIIIDEPERHLHRSITSPFLSGLFEKRKDCSFIVSTHEVYLPIDNPEATVLLLRGCEWDKDQASQWDVNLLKSGNNIPDDIKKQILGTKRKILFVEGKDNSLDKHLYEILYDDVTVIPVGSCVEVEQRVKAMRKVEEKNNLDWPYVYGVIDGDSKTAEDKNKLKQDNIIALPCYAVESLYYRSKIVKFAAEEYAATCDGNADNIHQKAYSKILEDTKDQKDNLCARKVEQKIKNDIVLPDWRYIRDNSQWKGCKNLKSILEEEKDTFDKLVSDKDWDALIDRYPVKKTRILENIAIPFGKASFFQGIVRQIVRKDKNGIKAYYKNELLKDLTELIEGDSE